MGDALLPDEAKALMPVERAPSSAHSCSLAVQSVTRHTLTGRRLFKAAAAVGGAALLSLACYRSPLAAVSRLARDAGLPGPGRQAEQASLRGVVQDAAAEACYDGTYEGETGLKSFFWSFGTTWEWWGLHGGGLVSTAADRRDQLHHGSILRSSTFIVTPETRLSIVTRGGIGKTATVQGHVADFSASSNHNGFLGVAIWQKATGQWAVSKRRTKVEQDEDEEIIFGPNDLAGVVGLEVSIDIIDTFHDFWGWLMVRSLRLEGTCVSEVEIPALMGGMAATGEDCTFSGKDGLHSVFGSVGGTWDYQTFGGGLLSSAEGERDSMGLKSLLRSVPIKITPTTSFTIVTRGGHGGSRRIDGTSSVEGTTSRDGFLGVALRDVLLETWVLSKNRSAVDSQDSDDETTFSQADLADLVGTVVTIDVVDFFHGMWGWIMVRELRLHGPCATTQTNVPLTWTTTEAPAIVVYPTTPSAPTEPPMPGDTYEDEFGNCQVRRTETTPRLYCFSVMTTYEIPLIAEQFKRKIGIFECNDHNVISVIPMSIGLDECGKPYYTWLNDVKISTLGNVNAGQATSSYLNTATFILAWDTLIAGGKVTRNDWIIKVDPDCVFFPNRLREHLRPHTGSPVMVKNCALYGGRLFGAVEAFSVQAINIYTDARDQCKASPWQGWGEDLYIENCLLHHGATSVDDYMQVGDSRCNGVACSDASVAAYHPFKDVDGWIQCWESSPK